MSDEIKTTMSKKKKVLIIVFSIVAFLLFATICAGIGVLNWYCETKEFTVASVSSDISKNEDLKLVAHRGFNAVAPENTIPAFEQAGQNGYYGAECDVYRTKDGVWVIQHDVNTFRMMDKTANIEKKTYDELMTYAYDNGTNIDNYVNLRICTLEEYLKVCKEYDMKAVIELKGKNNTEHYDEIMDTINSTEMNDDVVFISFHLENLKKVRELSDAPVWYLLNEITDDGIADAQSLGGDCGIDFDANNDKNTDEVIKKAVKAGMTLGAWTINDSEQVSHLYKLGVTVFTTNCITY